MNSNKQHRRNKSGSAPHFVSNYTITDETMIPPSTPPELEGELERLHDLACSSFPFYAIWALKKVLRQYPDVPVLLNYLSVAYNRCWMRKKATTCIRRNYEMNPEYIFARINFATLLIDNGELEEVPDVFDYKFEIGQLYPKRNVFHISEVIAFNGVVGLYFAQIGEIIHAKVLLDILLQLQSDSPYVRLLQEDIATFEKNKEREQINNFVA